MATWRRILAVLRARNREFYRDRAGLGWNVFMPVLFVFGFAVIFSGEPEPLFKIGVLPVDQDRPEQGSPVTRIKHIELVSYQEAERAIEKVQRHQVDLLVEERDPPRYWVNPTSQKGYFAEKLLLDAYREAGSSLPERQTVQGQALRYVDWVLPGILAMNIMFSCFWGVGWVIVRYRKNGVLRRLQATPLTAFEFLTAQVLSRLLVVMTATLVIYIGADLFLDFVMHGSYLTLLAVFAAGAVCLISMALVIAARIRTEELADGLLNALTWPMLLLSGVWFSMEGTSEIAQFLSRLSPLTYLVDAARRVMIDGAGLLELLPHIGLMVIAGMVLLALAARLFRWD